MIKMTFTVSIKSSYNDIFSSVDSGHILEVTVLKMSMLFHMKLGVLPTNPDLYCLLVCICTRWPSLLSSANSTTDHMCNASAKLISFGDVNFSPSLISQKFMPSSDQHRHFVYIGVCKSTKKYIVSV